MPLDPPVMSAARESMGLLGSGLGRLFERRVKEGRGATASPTLPRAVTPPRSFIAAALVACALLPAGCGGDDNDSGDSATPPARAADFPKANGVTLAQLRNKLPEGGPVLAPAVSDMVPGKNRFGF